MSCCFTSLKLLKVSFFPQEVKGSSNSKTDCPSSKSKINLIIWHTSKVTYIFVMGIYGWSLHNFCSRTFTSLFNCFHFSWPFLDYLHKCSQTTVLGTFDGEGANFVFSTLCWFALCFLILIVFRKPWKNWWNCIITRLATSFSCSYFKTWGLKMYTADKTMFIWFPVFLSCFGSFLQ